MRWLLVCLLGLTSCKIIPETALAESQATHTYYFKLLITVQGNGPRQALGGIVSPSWFQVIDFTQSLVPQQEIELKYDDITEEQARAIHRRIGAMRGLLSMQWSRE